jgi:hypothetical protein
MCNNSGSLAIFTAILRVSSGARPIDGQSLMWINYLFLLGLSLSIAVNVTLQLLQ